MGDPNVVTKRVPSKSESLPPLKWETVDPETIESSQSSSQPVVKDYKRRRQSYRAKMTHLTKRTPVQEHRDLINMRMKMLAEEGYHIIGKVENVSPL